MMAKKTVTSRACRQIVQQYGDSAVVASIEKDDNRENVDIIAEDVAYEINQNANSEEFQVDDDVEDVNAGDAEKDEVSAPVEDTEKKTSNDESWMSE